MKMTVAMTLLIKIRNFVEDISYEESLRTNLGPLITTVIKLPASKTAFVV